MVPDAQDVVEVYRTGVTLWVKLPSDVDPSILRGIKGSHYDKSMKMYAVGAGHVYSLIKALYYNEKVRQNYWPVRHHDEGVGMIADEVVALAVESERARLGSCQEDVPGFLEYKGTKPRPYQYDAAKFLVASGRAILALPMGSGKGCSVITALKLLQDRPVPKFRGAVVFCPSALKELVWKREVEKFSDFAPIVIDGNKQQRIAQYNTKADVYILNPELLHRDEKEIRKIVGMSSVIVVDEASILKNPESATSRHINALSQQVHNLWLMTGTPLMNSVMELHALVDMVDSNVFRSRDDFQRDYVPRAKDGSWLLRKVKNEKALVNKVAPLMFARTPVELRDELPSTTNVLEPVELTDHQRELYDALRKNLVRALEDYNDANKYDRFLLMNNVLTMITRMKQVCNGDLDDGPNPKIDRLLHLLGTSFINDKVLVFSQYATYAVRIVESLEKAGIKCALLHGGLDMKERTDAVDGYQNDPECRVFVMTTAGGMGLNLTKTTVVLFYDLLWNPQMMHQIAARAVRIGNTSPHVRIVSLLARNTIEETIMCRLQEKAETFNRIMHAEKIAPEDTEGDDMFNELYQTLKSR